MTIDFTLYHLDYCPCCHRIRLAADQLGISLELVDLQDDPSARSGPPVPGSAACPASC